MKQIVGKRLSKWMRGYYLGSDHPMKMRLWSYLRRMCNYPRLMLPYGNKGWISIDERCLLQRSILVNGTYEPEIWHTLSKFSVADEIVWDTGAHIGSFSIQALTASSVQVVHAFEPDPYQFVVLRNNLQLNKGVYQIHPFALSDRDESSQFFRGPQANTGLSSLSSQSIAAQLHNEIIKVDCYTTDTVIYLMGIPAPTLWKIDVEGWELAVLRGARKLLTEMPPKAIIFESESDHRGDLIDRNLLNFLYLYNYRVQRIQRFSGEIEQRENFLAVYAAI